MTIIAPELTLPTSNLREMVHEVVNDTPVLDMHTHLFAPQFGTLNLYGIDELLTYHYLVAEYFRLSPVSEERFWGMTKAAQADAIWQTLFVENTPLSEAACGVVCVLNALGLDTSAPDLRQAREFFADVEITEHIEHVMRLSGVTHIVMTNDPFDAEERKVWDCEAEIDPRFKAVLRLDALLNQYDTAVPKLQAAGYKVGIDLDKNGYSEIRRFLDDWLQRMEPVYMAVSLPDDFCFPEDSVRGRLLQHAVLPCARENKLPLALMIGVRRQVNPRLRLAGDGVGYSDLRALQNLCLLHPDNRFLVTVLARENQHELCVLARKFRNLMPFGCWWFLNNPTLIGEVTRMRLEMLGTTFIPQHSDARVLEQLLYKWPHSKRVIADAMADSYEQLVRDGREVLREHVSRDAALLFRGNFVEWAKL